MATAAWALLGILLVLDTASHLLLKGAAERAESDGHYEFLRRLFADPMLWLALACFVFLLVVWVAFYSLVPLSQGVMTACLTIVGVMVGGRIFFREAITLPRAAAVTLIAAGVFLVGWDAA